MVDASVLYMGRSPRRASANVDDVAVYRPGWPVSSPGGVRNAGIGGSSVGKHRVGCRARCGPRLGKPRRRRGRLRRRRACRRAIDLPMSGWQLSRVHQSRLAMTVNGDRPHFQLFHRDGNPGLASVTSVAGPRRSLASCTCGWSHRPQWLRSAAVIEALLHCSAGNCAPNDPLIGDAEPRRSTEMDASQ